jgi:two-component system sensor histidine kinase YesM
VTIRGHTLAGAAGPEVVLAVEDDGVGIAAAQLARLLEERDATSEHGYGVRNIDRRLKVEYGEEYGLSFRAQPGVGTSVTIRIPLGTGRA